MLTIKSTTRALLRQKINISHFNQRKFSAFASTLQNAQDFLPLHGTDHVEIYTSNAKQSAHWYHSVMGFQPVAYSGLETGNRIRASYCLQQGDIRLVVTSPYEANCSDRIGEHIKIHGDGISAPTVFAAHRFFHRCKKNCLFCEGCPRSFQSGH
eukprot:Selendium_serpulae@DN5566_c0_g1_i2.p1